MHICLLSVSQQVHYLHHFHRQPAAVPNIPRSVVDFGRVCLVVKVVPGGIGGSHDIRGGDIITSVNGQYVHAIEDIVASTRDASLLQIRGWRVFRSPPPATTQQQSQTYPANLYKAPVQSVDTQVTQLPRKPSTAGDWRSTATVSASSAPAPPECATSASMSSSVRSSSSPIRKRSKKKTVKTKPALAVRPILFFFFFFFLYLNGIFPQRLSKPKFCAANERIHCFVLPFCMIARRSRSNCQLRRLPWRVH